jgi:hypothetical protein
VGQWPREAARAGNEIHGEFLAALLPGTRSWLQGSRSGSRSRRNRGTVLVLPSFVLCAAAIAQTPPPPKTDGGGAGGDGACSESSQKVGDGTLLSIVGTSGNPTDSVIDGMTKFNLPEEPMVNMGSINFQPSGMPHSRYAGGTVTSTGELVVQIPVWSRPAIAGHSLDLAFLYRTHVTASAMPELGPAGT